MTNNTYPGKLIHILSELYKMIGKAEYYSLLLINQLSESNNISLSSISSKLSIPNNFLYKIALKLKIAGIIESKEGQSGGYKLKMKKEDISIYDIVKAIKEEKECKCETNDKHCGEIKQCHINSKIDILINEKLKDIKINNI